MNWKDVGGYVKQYAPALGAAIGGPAGGAIGGAVSLIAGAFGITDPEPTPDQVMAAVKADPQAALKLQEINTRHRERLEELALEGDKAYLGDRQNARARDLALQQTGQRNTRANLMIAGDVLGLIVCLLIVFLVKDLPGEAQTLVVTFGSYFGLGLRDAHQFEFGSSRGSKEKDLLRAKPA
jgi:hypothetical protein